MSCHKCGNELSGTVISNDKKEKFHEHCYTYAKCSSCNLKITGTVTIALDRNWHKDCFKCKRCQKHLDTTFVVEGGDAFCTPECIRQHTGNTSISLKVGDFSDSHCHGCHEKLKDTKVVAMGHDWHEHCFKCKECHSHFKSKFNEKDGYPYCEKCYLHNFHDRCQGCGDHLVGKYFKVGDYHYHENCFKCNKCHTILGSSYYEKDGDYLCNKCSN
eukprot:TRINITY_DN15385_c0_g1_i1.p1 TRINITY_DN15385_c0_g1~~TRINITY_DN15385_c0_g1_i1.p1  ORF type:complete len:215 (+),score=34.13 TRINITY_DN15385_c0_g1_i1:81-725(+)